MIAIAELILDSKSMKTLREISNYDVVQNRIPYHFFRTFGKGESDNTIHAGSFHLALRDAGIESCNITHYSSILPAIAVELEARPREFYHGQELATIMAQSDTDRRERVTAGLGEAWLFDSSAPKERRGGIVAEYSGHGQEDEADGELRRSLLELYENKYRPKYVMGNPKITKASFVPKKRFATAIVALCFTDFIIPRN